MALGKIGKILRGGWWPADYVVIGYLLFTSALLIGWFRSIPDSGWLLAIHAAAIAALVRFRFHFVFHCWYPLPYVASCYKEMAILIPPIRAMDYDAWAARIDAKLWGVDPMVWLASRPSAAATEFLQICYAFFIPAVLLVCVFLWRQGKFHEFRYYGFLVALGFLASYLGYLAVPVRGPRFLAQGLPAIHGLWFTDIIQNTLDRLESAHYDCFPSGHTELTIIACWGSRLVSKKLFYLFLGYTPCIIFATVYLRYHYTIDVLAGAALAFVLIAVAPHVYTGLGKRGH
jgi:membrane-associated phospholipid phosphatase